MPLFARAIGPEAWERMPPSYRQAHSPNGSHVLVGRAEISRGGGLLSRAVARVFGFPPAGSDIAVTVTMTEKQGGELWVRDFAGRQFRSELTAARPGYVLERFGPFRFELRLPIKDRRMAMVVEKGWSLGIPFPRALLPVSDTVEFEADGRFHFDVRLSAPIVGFIVRYQGWLEPQ